MKPNQSQLAAIRSKESSILVIAGPGSGKTATLKERIASDIRLGADPLGMCVVTFTNAAAFELSQRIDKDLGYIGTLHSLCLRLIRKNPELAGFSEPPTVADEDLCASTLKDVQESLRYKGTKKDVSRAIDLGPKYLLEDDAGIDPAGAHAVARSYYQRLREAGLVDFEGILHFARHILAQKTEAFGFTRLYVDEYQDSSRLDADIYDLAPVAFSFFVGDPDQAIYGWRGGEVANILKKAKDDFIECVTLEENYRCDVSIAGAASRLIAFNKGRVPKLTIPVSELPGRISHTTVENEMAEAYEICQSITALVRDGTDPSDIAVLTRVNAMAHKIAECLRSSGLPVAEKSQTVNMPHDWTLTKRWVALLASPDNSSIAYDIVAAVRGREVADKLRMDALKECRSINDLALHIPYNVGVHAACEWLTRAGLTSQSVGNVASVVASLPRGASTSDLALAITSGDTGNPEIGEGITVTTIHCAKGREWDVVFLPGWNETTMPLPGAVEEEERRLGFVAITRAKHRVVIYSTRFRTAPWPGSKPKRVEVSKFVTEAIG